MSRRRGDLVVVLLVYVVPLLLTVALLYAVGLVVLATALLVIELVIAGIVLLVRRTPQREPGTSAPARRPWVVPVVMVGLLVAMVGIAVVASFFG